MLVGTGLFPSKTYAVNGRLCRPSNSIGHSNGMELAIKNLNHSHASIPTVCSLSIHSPQWSIAQRAHPHTIRAHSATNSERHLPSRFKPFPPSLKPQVPSESISSQARGRVEKPMAAAGRMYGRSIVNLCAKRINNHSMHRCNHIR